VGDSARGAPAPLGTQAVCALLIVCVQRCVGVPPVFARKETHGGPTPASDSATRGVGRFRRRVPRVWRVKKMAPPRAD